MRKTLSLKNTTARANHAKIEQAPETSYILAVKAVAG